MSHFRESIKKTGVLFAKFAVAGALASLVNYAVFNIMVYWVFAIDPSVALSATEKTRIIISEMIAYASGILFNFTLHKRFIFETKRSANATIALYILVSLVGMALSAGLTYLFVQIPFFAAYPYIMKIFTMGLVFIYNFFSKRFAFERRFFSTE
ncbi:MAG: GtrA family protein [Saprospiraceae bacterium]|nr:GtrA family protein [Saprospiraceae bacterium]